MTPDPHVWPPPPSLPEPQPPPPLKLPFGNERLGALSPLCVALGLAAAFLTQFLVAFAFVGGFLVLTGLVLGLLNWRTDGGKTGIGLVVIPPAFLLVLPALSRIH